MHDLSNLISGDPTIQVARMPHTETINQSIFPGQQGAALLLFFLLVLITGTLFVAGKVALDKGSTRYEENTSGALAKAKEALLAYAISHYEQGFAGEYGFLPCPEQAGSPSEGSEQGNCESRYENAFGRFPWRTLDLEPLKDSAGECLWYAVSADFKNGSTAQTSMHNEDSTGMFVLWDDNLNIIHGAVPEERVAAVVIAPGPPLAGQARQAADPAVPCKVPRNLVDPVDYLETLGGYDNSNVSSALDSIDNFVTAASQRGDNLNDRVIAITAGEIFEAIKKRPNFHSRMDTLATGLALCIAAYGRNNVQAGGVCDPVNVCQDDCQTAWINCRITCAIERLI